MADTSETSNDDAQQSVPSSSSHETQDPKLAVVPSEPEQEPGTNAYDPNTSVNPTKTESDNAGNAVSSHKEPEKTNTSPSSNGVKVTDNSASSHAHHSEETKSSENISSNSNNQKKKTVASSVSNVDDFGRSNISDISYAPDELDLLESILTNATNQKLIDRLLGCAYGQALGDAYGLATEFEDRHDVIRTYGTDCKLIPFPGYVLTGHNRRWSRGDWTDDTDQWVLILDTLVHHNGDEKVFAKKLTNWIRYGYPELGDHGGMGLGANVSEVVRSSNYLYEPLTASKAVWERSGRQAAPNGAVMRCSASAFVHFNDPEKVKSTAVLMCQTTHFDPRCIASCLAVCLTITYLLREEANNDDIESLVKRVADETLTTLATFDDSFSDDHRDKFLWHIHKDRTLEELNLDEQRSIGYTYKCLASGFYGLRSTRSFEETLNDLIRYGGDADTNGAVCGTMYGARYGYRKLPYKWLREMPNKKWLDQQLIICLEKMNVIENITMDTTQ